MDNLLKLTSVQVQTDLHERFKRENSRRVFTFHNLVNRALFLYLTDENFKDIIDKQTNTSLE